MFSSIQLQLLPCRACNLGRPISRHLFHVVHAGTITIKEMLRGLSVKGTIGAGAMASPHVSHAHVVGHKRCHPNSPADLNAGCSAFYQAAPAHGTMSICMAALSWSLAEVSSEDS